MQKNLQEYEEYGNNQNSMHGGLAYINPGEASHNANAVFSALDSTYGGRNSVWANPDDVAPQGSRVGPQSKSIWGRPGIKRTKDVMSRREHPAQHFFQQRGS